MGVSGIAVLGRNDVDKVWTELHCTIHLYEANIAADCILSYGWLGSQSFVVEPRRHGLRFEVEDCKVFVPGVEKDRIGKKPPAILNRVEAVRLSNSEKKL